MKFKDTFLQLRKNTTYKLHTHLSSKLLWYKKWHNFKFHQHVHISVAAIVLGVTVFNVLLYAIKPEFVFASNGSWSQTAFAGSGDGTYTNTSKNYDGTSAQLSETKLSNDGGGEWNYRKKITVNNTAGGALTDYQVVVDSEKDTIAHFNFDEGTGTTVNDSSSNNLSATMNNTAAWTANGRFRSAFNTAGAYYANLNDTVSTRAATQFSIEAWVKTSTTDATTRYIYQEDCGTTTYARIQFYVQSGTEKVVLGVSPVDGGATNATTVVSTTALIPNVWHHVVGTWYTNGTNLIENKIYINGQLENTASLAVAQASIANTAPYNGVNYVGAGRSVAGPFKGSIDEFKFYNKALGSTDVYSNKQKDPNKIYNDSQSDGDDIRFTDSDGKTELPYWLETFNNTTTGKKNYKVWAKVPSIGAATVKDIYMYYGNSAASSSSNGTNTFVFFDDFNGPSVDTTKWTEVGSGTKSFSGGVLTYSGTAVGLNADGVVLISKTNFGANTAFESKRYFDHTAANPVSIGYGRYSSPITTNAALETDYSSGDTNVYFATQGGSANTGYNAGAWTTDWGRLSIKRKSTSTIFNLDGYTAGARYSYTSTTNIPVGLQPIIFGDSYYSSSNAFSVRTDWLFVRNIADTEPTITEYGGLARMPYKKDITFNTSATGANVATAQYDFPIAVHLNSSSMPDATERSHFFGSWNINGKRAQLWESDESTALDYEVEYYDQATQEAIYWVRVPKVDGNLTTDKIKIGYGRDPGADQDNQTSVWINGYGRTFHLKEGFGTTAADSSGFADNTGTLGAGAAWSLADGGSIGRGLTLNGTSTAYVDASTYSPITNSNVTLEAWIKPTSIGGQFIIAKGNDATTSYSYGLQLGTSNNLRVMIGSSTGVFWVATTPSNSLTVGQWNHVAATISGANVTTYINGSSAGTGTFTGTISSSTQPLWFGAQNRTGYTYNVNGALDEVTLGVVARSADYIKLEYYSTKKINFNGDNGVSAPFITYGAETTGNYVAKGYQTSGTFTTVVLPSTATHQGKVYAWGNLSFTNTLNSQTVTYDILDGVSGSAITGYTGITTSPIDLSGVSPYIYPSLKVRSNLSGSGSVTPTVDDVALSYFYDITAPTVPANLATSNPSSTSVDLSWTASTDSESGLDVNDSYSVERATDSGGSPTGWTEIGTSNTNSFSATGLLANTKYYFRVRAKDAVGNYSGYTGEYNTDANTVVLWHLNETSGVTTTDSSGNSNTGYARDVQLDNMDATTGWSVSQVGMSVSLNTSTKHEGTGAVNIVKDVTSTNDAYIYKYITTTNVTNRYINTWVYIKDAAVLAKVRDGSQSSQIYIYDTGGGIAAKYIPKSDLAVGWNILSFDANNYLSVVGTPNMSIVNTLRVDVDTILATDTFVTGDIIVDDWFMTEKKQVAGKFDNALSFDGVNDYVTVSNPSINTANGSIDAWIKLNSLPAVAGTIAAKWYDGAGSYGYRLLVLPNGFVQMNITDGSGIDSASTGPLSLGQWYKVTGTWSAGAGVSIYVNGVKRAGPIGTRTINYSGTSNLNIGRNVSEWHLSGQIDEVRISNIARSESEILQSYIDGSLNLTTLPGTPILSDPVDYTNDSTPSGISGTGTSANVTVKLYKNNGSEQEIASTTADGSGNFTFPAYTGVIDEGLNTVYVKAFNVSGDYSQSNSQTITLDVHNPDAPANYTIAKTLNSSGSDISDNGWSLNNNVDTIYFEWAAATDPTPPNPSSGIKRYWTYFGSDSGATPSTDPVGEVTADSNPIATKVLSGPTSGSDYYLRVQSEDNSGNLSSVSTLFTYKFDNISPSPVSVINVSPAGWATVDPFVFTWQDPTAPADSHSGLYGYDYKVNDSSPTWTTVQTVVTDTATVNHYQTGVNYFLITTVDNAGNRSTQTSMPYLYSGNVQAPTNLQINYAEPVQKINSMKFSWAPPAVGNIVGYYYAVNNFTPDSSTFIEVDNGTDCTDTLCEIPYSSYAETNNTNNTFYVAAKDEFGNVGWSFPATISFSVNTDKPEVPQDVKITDASDRNTSNWALTVSWTDLANKTPDFTGYEVWRCTANCNDDANFNDRRGTVSTNIFSEAGLNNVTDFYYKIKAIDSVGNTSDFSSTVHKTPTGNYIIPPVYTSGPNIDVKAQTAGVNWTTDRASSSKVLFGTSEPACPGVGPNDDTQVTDHNVTLTGLQPGIKYYYKVQSLDQFRDYPGGDVDACSVAYEFTTLVAPGISQVSISDIGLYSAIITWKTSSSSTSTIKYGPSTSYGKEVTDASGSSVTNHTIKIDGLDHSSTYHFKIFGTDVDGNPMQSDDYSFNTLVFPRVFSVKFEGQKNTATSTMKVTWESNIPLSSVVEYKEVGGASKESSSSKLVFKHEILVPGLKDNTDYIMSVKGRDAYGNEASSEEQQVRTDFDTRPPETFNINVETSVTGNGLDAKVQAVVSWETDELSTSQVEYAIGITGSEYTFKSQEDTTLTTTHVVVVSDLKPATTYHFRVISKDKSKNEGLSDDSYFLTEQASESILGLILRSIEKAFGWLFNF